LEWPTAAEWRSERKKKKKEREKMIDEGQKIGGQLLQNEGVQRGLQQGRAAAAAAGGRVAGAAGRARRIAGGSVGGAVAALGGTGVAAAVLAAGAAGYGVGYLLNRWIERNRDAATPEAIRAQRTILIIQQRRKWEKDNGRAMTQSERQTFNRNAGL
jgi:hypothetical protein